MKQNFYFILTDNLRSLRIINFGFNNIIHVLCIVNSPVIFLRDFET